MSNHDQADCAPTSRQAGRNSSHLGLIAHGIAWGFWLAFLGLFVPRLEAKFGVFGVPLPRITILVIRLSRGVAFFAVLALVLLVADTLMRNARSDQGESGPSRAWSVLMLAVPLLGIVLTVAALALPFFTLDGPLSG